MDKFGLKSKVTIITGAASGIGRATAVMFAEQGAQLALIDIKDDNLYFTEKIIKEKGGSCKCYACDLTDVQALQSIFQDIFGHFKKIDILVNAAGIWDYAPFLKMEHSQLDRMMEVNFKGCFNIIKLVLPQMLERRYGKIVCVASVGGKVGSALGASHYAASKGALILLVRSLAKEFGSYGINFNCVAPGLIDTPMAVLTGPEAVKIYAESCALKRMGKPEEVASVIAFLSSDLSSFVTGQAWNVCGGYLLE